MAPLSNARIRPVSPRTLRSGYNLKWEQAPTDSVAASVAEMDFQLSPALQSLFRRAGSRSQAGYLSKHTSDQARYACAQWQLDLAGWAVSPDDVFLTRGVLHGYALALKHLVPATHRVYLPQPAFGPLASIPRSLGFEVFEIPMQRVDGHYCLDLEMLRAELRVTRGLVVVCNPHNPTGAVMSDAEAASLIEIIATHGGLVFADEVYGPLVYPPRTHTPLASRSDAAADMTITAVSASKAWNLSGMACAQLIVQRPEFQSTLRGLDRLETDGVSSLGAAAAHAAYSDSRQWLRSLVSYLDGSRRELAKTLATDSAVDFTWPEATFFAWLRLDTHGTGHKAGPLPAGSGAHVSPGAEFGRGLDSFVRVNFACSRKRVRQVATSIVGQP